MRRLQHRIFRSGAPKRNVDAGTLTPEGLRAARDAMSGFHVRRDKAALFQWVQGPPASAPAGSDRSRVCKGAVDAHCTTSTADHDFRGSIRQMPDMMCSQRPFRNAAQPADLAVFLAVAALPSSAGGTTWPKPDNHAGPFRQDK
jgi:hypothetical protein